MTRTTKTTLAILALSAALLPAAAHAAPGDAPAVKNDTAYNGMGRNDKVNYLASVIDAGRQAALAAKEKQDEAQKMEEQKGKVQRAMAAAADAGLSTADAARKLALIDSQIAGKKAEADGLLSTARNMAAEARKRKDGDSSIHQDALNAALRAERGEATGPTVQLLGKRDRSTDK